MLAERKGTGGSGGIELLAIELPPNLDSAAEARAALKSLAPALPTSVLQDLQLLVSELVTNSLKHAGLAAGDVIDLRVKRLNTGVRVEVIDPGRRFAPSPKARPSDAGGWGLHIVGAVADRWGVDAAHNRVWFELSSGAT
jgi:anti-sigma regulatory factor (Ser/Thr protein kinase)